MVAITKDIPSSQTRYSAHFTDSANFLQLIQCLKPISYATMGLLFCFALLNGRSQENSIRGSSLTSVHVKNGTSVPYIHIDINFDQNTDIGENLPTVAVARPGFGESTNVPVHVNDSSSADGKANISNASFQASDLYTLEGAHLQDPALTTPQPNPNIVTAMQSVQNTVNDQPSNISMQQNPDAMANQMSAGSMVADGTSTDALAVQTTLDPNQVQSVYPPTSVRAGQDMQHNTLSSPAIQQGVPNQVQAQQLQPPPQIPTQLQPLPVAQIPSTNIQNQVESTPMSQNLAAPMQQQMPEYSAANDSIQMSPATTGLQPIEASLPQGRLPAIYTFYERINPEERGTGMDDTSDSELLQAWKDRWAAAGWEPRVLTLEDAKKHPRYEEYQAMLKDIPMGGKSGKGKNRLYNELCFLRWLAMAAVGGGIMSDYDLFPLGPHATGSSTPPPMEVPNGGSFTVYSIAKDSQGAGIPCLMSGSSSEWTRVAFSIVQNAVGQKDTNTGHYTDMFALQSLRFENIYQWQDDVVDGENVLIGHDWSPEDCQITSGKRAVHFSHSAMTNGDAAYIKGGVLSVSDRPGVIAHWLDVWNNVCLPLVQ